MAKGSVSTIANLFIAMVLFLSAGKETACARRLGCGFVSSVAGDFAKKIVARLLARPRR
jgi:hypothetical protein